MRTLLWVHAAATWSMVGLIWFVQVVHYPLFQRVGGEGFRRYHAEHVARTGRVVMPLMSVEAIAALLLAIPAVSAAAPLPVWIGLGLLMIAWLSTGLIQVPAHRRLARGYDPATAMRLARTNWIRTLAWTARGAIALRLLA
jgi:hypothetical protein